MVRTTVASRADGTVTGDGTTHRRTRAGRHASRARRRYAPALAGRRVSSLTLKTMRAQDAIEQVLGHLLPSSRIVGDVEPTLQHIGDAHAVAIARAAEHRL